MAPAYLPPQPPAAVCAAEPNGAALQAFLRLAAPPARGDTVVTATLCLVARDEADAATAVGSYRGELRFDTAAVRVARVARGGGGLRLDNAAHPGRLIFAGAAPRGFADPVVLRVMLRLRDPRGGVPALHLRVTELSSAAGADLTARLAVRGLAPLPSSSPSAARPGAL